MSRSYVSDRSFQELGTQARNALTQIQSLLRGGQSLHVNVKPETLTVAFAAAYVAGTAVTVDTSSRKLAWVPDGFIQVMQDVAATLFATSADKAAWTSSQMTLRSGTNGAHNVTIWLV